MWHHFLSKRKVLQCFLKMVRCWVHLISSGKYWLLWKLGPGPYLCFRSWLEASGETWAQALCTHGGLSHGEGGQPLSVSVRACASSSGSPQIQRVTVMQPGNDKCMARSSCGTKGLNVSVSLCSPLLDYTGFEERWSIWQFLCLSVQRQLSGFPLLKHQKHF